ncbi:MAG TPA: geranylgeranylglycerol-phosphate geranylgeranyltransferase [Saprospiraceae bacterium]|nr:geranylgeranylglycerol-phosphate geranylgeranyltransferase [Saprospiraceae bacterium]
MAFFRLIRLPNLIIVGLTQWLIFQQLFLNNYQTLNISPKLAGFLAPLLFMSTIFITAGGYIINDLFDQGIDAINKPNKRIVGRKITSQIATWLYVLFSMLAFFLFFYICLKGKFIQYFFIYPGILFLLVAYSYRLKKMPLVGNLLIAFLCAAVPGLVWLFEWDVFLELQRNAPTLARRISGTMIWYMCFAFLGTLYREIVKDIEDQKGDARFGLRTIPVIYGESQARVLAFFTGGLLFILLLIQFVYLNNYFSQYLLVFALLGVFIPLGISFQRLASAKNKRHYWIVSQIIKVILLNGVLLLFFL